MSVVRRMRAVAVLGGIWAIAWAGVGIGLVTCAFFLSHPRFVIPLAYWTRTALDVARVFGVFGFAAGAFFALGLSTERAETADDMPLLRAARWGALAGAAPAIATAFVVPISPKALVIATVIGVVVGSASAALTVRASRRPLPTGGSLDSRLPSAHA